MENLWATWIKPTEVNPTTTLPTISPIILHPSPTLIILIPKNPLTVTKSAILRKNVRVLPESNRDIPLRKADFGVETETNRGWVALFDHEG